MESRLFSNTTEDLAVLMGNFGSDVMLNGLLDEIVQHYTISISVAGTILDPALPVV